MVRKPSYNQIDRALSLTKNRSQRVFRWGTSPDEEYPKQDELNTLAAAEGGRLRKVKCLSTNEIRHLNGIIHTVPNNGLTFINVKLNIGWVLAMVDTVASQI